MSGRPASVRAVRMKLFLACLLYTSIPGVCWTEGTPGPVSDAWQSCACSVWSWYCPAVPEDPRRGWADPVSYTHLDVYKRQPPAMMPNAPPLMSIQMSPW